MSAKQPQELPSIKWGAGPRPTSPPPPTATRQSGSVLGASGGKTSQLNLVLSEAIRSRMEAMRDDTEAESITEVVRRSLAVYDHLITRTKEGASVIIREDGKETELLVVP